MSLFLLVFFVLYGALHAYLLVKLRAAFNLGLPLTLICAAFMILMVGGPWIVRVAERAGMEWLAVTAASIAYPWMGFLCLFFCASVAVDVLRLIVWLAGFLGGWGWSGWPATRAAGVSIALMVSLCVSIYGFFEAGRVKTERLSIPTAKLPEAVGEFRIVQISDLHLGIGSRDRWFDQVVSEVRDLKPHMLVCTGDLMDGRADALFARAEALRSIHAPFGKFAITGNHEFYAGLGNFRRFAESAGFKILRGEGISAGGVVNVAGVDDITGIPYGDYRKVDEAQLLNGLTGGRFNLLLKHRPVVDLEAAGNFDLQLSGHTHKGQIYPLRYLVKAFFPYLSGWFDLPGGSMLYVSRGTGSWGPPIRFLCPPEITLITLSAAGGQGDQGRRQSPQSP